jgi:hypothetical protein
MNKESNMQNDRNYYRMLNNKELIGLAQEDNASELALVLAERLVTAEDELAGYED